MAKIRRIFQNPTFIPPLRRETVFWDIETLEQQEVAQAPKYASSLEYKNPYEYLASRRISGKFALLPFHLHINVQCEKPFVKGLVDLLLTEFKRTVLDMMKWYEVEHL